MFSYLKNGSNSITGRKEGNGELKKIWILTMRKMYNNSFSHLRPWPLSNKIMVILAHCKQ